MTIEATLERIAVGIETLVQIHQGAGAPAPTQGTAPAPAPGAATMSPAAHTTQAPAPAPAPAPEATLQQVNEAMVAKATAMGDNGAAVLGILSADYGATTLSQIDASHYGEILAKVNALGG